MSDSINKSTKTWMIISWRHIDHLDDAYGKLIDVVDGTYEEAAKEARGYVGYRSPIGLVEVIQ